MKVRSQLSRWSLQVLSCLFVVLENWQKGHASRGHWRASWPCSPQPKQTPQRARCLRFSFCSGVIANPPSAIAAADKWTADIAGKTGGGSGGGPAGRAGAAGGV